MAINQVSFTCLGSSFSLLSSFLSWLSLLWYCLLFGWGSLSSLLWWLGLCRLLFFLLSGFWGLWSFYFFMLVMCSPFFFNVFRKNLFVFSSLVLGGFVFVQSNFLFQSLSSQSLFSDNSLDSRRFVESLVTFLDFSSHDVLSYIILLSQSEDLSNVVSSLWSQLSWLISISDSFNFSFSLLHDLESNHSKVWSTDATSDRLSFSFSSSSWSVCSCPYINCYIKILLFNR